MLKSGIYAIVNTTNDKVYIGSAVYIKVRLSVHKKHLIAGTHVNIHLQRAWDKYGDGAFVFTIIERCEKDKLIEREQYWIDELEPSYNILKKAGSFLGYKASVESNEKRRRWSTGRKLSEEIKSLLADQKIGNNHGRNKDRWPCENGVHCRCIDCATVVKLEQFFRNKKMREPKIFIMVPNANA